VEVKFIGIRPLRGAICMHLFKTKTEMPSPTLSSAMTWLLHEPPSFNMEYLNSACRFLEKVQLFMIILLTDGSHHGCQGQDEFAFRFYESISRIFVV
jgi:hypothetical protein